LSLAGSVAFRHIADDPVRAIVLASRALPGPLRGLVRLAGPYGRAAALWNSGQRRAALAALEAHPARLAAFSLAVDQPQVARSALTRLPEGHRAARVLAARLARREGQLTDVFAAERRLLDPAFWVTSLGGNDPPQTPPANEGLRGPRAPAGGPAAPRILHIVTDALPTTNAGYTVRTQEIAVAQRFAGLDPHVVTRIGFPVTSGKLDGRFLVSVDGVPYHRLLPWVLPRSADAMASRHLALASRLVSSLKPAVLHAHSNYVNGMVGLALRQRYGLPLVYEVRGFWEDTWLSRHPGLEDTLRASEVYRATRALETLVMTSADLVVTLGAAMKAEIVSRGVPPEKVLLAPNGVSSAFLSPLPPGAALRASLGIDPSDFVVGTVTSLFGYEGIGTLLSAAAAMGTPREAREPRADKSDISGSDPAAQAGKSVKVLIVGDGPERASLERQAASLGVEAIFTGRVPPGRVRDYHAVLDAFVVPRTPDRVCQLVTPLKPVEAMASGLPVVLSDVAALAEIVTDGVTGLLFPPLDAEALADRLRLLRADPSLRARLGREAHAWAAGRTWALDADTYLAAYTALAPSPEGHR
jgi:glycosyltransferase involved in cell wall biosynthesis